MLHPHLIEMKNGLQRGRSALTHTLCMRVLAFFCVALVGGIGTAQAAHIHGQWLPKTDVHVSIPAAAPQGESEEHCSLCVAMHSTLPVVWQVLPDAVCCDVQLTAARVLHAPEKLWSFASFSRPPPVALRGSVQG